MKHHSDSQYHWFDLRIFQSVLFLAVLSLASGCGKSSSNTPDADQSVPQQSQKFPEPAPEAVSAERKEISVSQQSQTSPEPAQDLFATEKTENQETGGQELLRCDEKVTTIGCGISISKDRQLVACPVHSDNIVYIWDITAGQVVATLNPPSGAKIPLVAEPITAFSSDSQYVASILKFDYSDRVVLWELESGDIVGTFAGIETQEGDDSFNGLAVTSDFVFACGESANKKAYPVRVWNRENGVLVHSFEGHSKEVNCISISPDGKMAASGGKDRIAILWDVESGTEIRICDDHESSIEAISFSADGDMILTGGFDCTVRLWDVSNGRLKRKWQLGDYDSIAEAQWRASIRQSEINFLTTNRFSPVKRWTFPYVNSVDFSPSGDRAIIGLQVVNPQSLQYGSNPVMLDLMSHNIVRLPSSFASRPMSRVWAAFDHDGSAVIFNNERRERVRGESKAIPYLSVTTVPGIHSGNHE